MRSGLCAMALFLLVLQSVSAQQASQDNSPYSDTGPVPQAPMSQQEILAQQQAAGQFPMSQQEILAQQQAAGQFPMSQKEILAQQRARSQPLRSQANQAWAVGSNAQPALLDQRDRSESKAQSVRQFKRQSAVGDVSEGPPRYSQQEINDLQAQTTTMLGRDAIKAIPSLIIGGLLGLFILRKLRSSKKKKPN